MTSHYVDLAVVPDVETSSAALFGALYDRLHRYLARHHIERIGVSFPQYSVSPRTIGTILRVHGSAADLDQLMAVDWQGGVRDHIRCAAIAAVPDLTLHRCIRRRQFKTGVERLRRRRMKRRGETAEQAAVALPDSAAEKPNLPYVHLRSSSTGQSFCLFIAIGPLQPAPVGGPFNTYGLSDTSTIPWF
ncbi:MAG: type I-F CRISPR-associated endoribonuclease Cas6/Csy4 [Xanthomonadaceae bacterium]|jgi:CRISPR-associated endonuclease Csy4|nr:type I-F CRISPR-associated endoribonuclease Cas6/Csy4 [Xanthomonadaceae bacterium]